MSALCWDFIICWYWKDTFVLWDETIEGTISHFVLWKDPRESFIVFSVLSGHSRDHIFAFCLLEMHCRGHFVGLCIAIFIQHLVVHLSTISAI